MIVTSHQRWNCPFVGKCLTKWFVLSVFALMYSLHARGCTDSLHKVGDNVQLNCSVSGDISGSPLCRDASSFQYQNCQPDKYCVKFDNATKSIIFTIASATENNFTKYQCGARFSATAKVNLSCCFNLIQVSINSSPDSAVTSLSYTTTMTTKETSQEETNTSISTIQPNISDSNTPSTGCVNKIELKNQTPYKDICTKERVSYDRLNLTTKCLEKLMKGNGNKFVTFNVQHEDRGCKVTCYYSNSSCEVTSPGSRSSEGSPTSSYKTTDQGVTIYRTTGQSHNVLSNSQSTENSDTPIVYIIMYILCGVMFALVVLIVGLCFYLFSDKKPHQNSIYSHTLGDIKPTQIELYAQNSSTSNSNYERERNENRDEKNFSDQILASETSGWEDNVAYETCTNVTEEGDYADVNDKHSFKEEDETTLSETEKRNRKAPSNSNSNLYECVIDKGE